MCFKKYNCFVLLVVFVFSFDVFSMSCDSMYNGSCELSNNKQLNRPERLKNRRERAASRNNPKNKSLDAILILERRRLNMAKAFSESSYEGKKTLKRHNKNRYEKGDECITVEDNTLTNIPLTGILIETVEGCEKGP